MIEGHAAAIVAPSSLDFLYVSPVSEPKALKSERPASPFQGQQGGRNNQDSIVRAPSIHRHLAFFRLERMQYSRVVTCAHCDLWWDVLNIWWKVCTAIHEGSPSFNVSQTISIQGIGMHIAAFLVSHDAHDQWKKCSTPTWLREAIIMTDNMRWKHGCWMKCVNPRETRGEYIDRSNPEEVYYDNKRIDAEWGYGGYDFMPPSLRKGLSKWTEVFVEGKDEGEALANWFGLDEEKIGSTDS